MPIRFRLSIIFLSLVTIPLLFVGLLTFANYQKSLKESRLLELREMARFKAERIEGYFEELTNSMEMVQSFYNIRMHLPVFAQYDPHSAEAAAARKALDMQLIRTQKILRLADIMLAALDGKIVYTSNPDHRAGDISRSVAAILPAALKESSKGIFISDIFLNAAVGNKAEMVVTASVLDMKGFPAGSIIFEIDMAPLYSLIQDTTGLGLTGETLLGKKMGNEIVYLNPLRHDPGAALKRKVVIGGPAGIPIQRAVGGETGVGMTLDYRGKKVVSAWRYISSVGWGLVAKIDAKEEFAVVTDLQRLAMLILAVTLLMTGIITFSVARSVSLPIKKLSQGAEIIGSGNLDHRVGTTLKDEIGQLSRAFDKMAKDLKQTTASRDELNREIVVRTKAEEASRRFAEDLERSNKDLEQFAYVASHDLQEPLRAVGGFIGLLKKQYGKALDAGAIEYIDLSIEGAERMQTLIHDLLAFSRVGTRGDAFKPLPLQEPVEMALRNLHVPIAETGTTVLYDNLPKVSADRSQMIQLMQNLIGNAVKFHGTRKPEVRIAARRGDSEWVVSVADNGIGIDPHYFNRIFLVFQRLHTRREYKGNGIGLALCKKIVERHGGRIWVESKPEEGSVFYFTLPDKGDNV